MAWRIDSHVLRGEVDNRSKGRVVGRFWFQGRAEPVEIELQGNASRDLAGRQLTFVNTKPTPGLAPSFAARQVGVVGEFTASRKRRVPDIPLEEVADYYARKEKFPWHWGNCVYFEWFSAANGHVVIESAEYQLTISPESTWDMSAEEESRQSEANARSMERFFQQLGFLSTAAEPREELEDDGTTLWNDSDEAESWKSEQPLSEEEADALMADSDKLADRLLARLNEAGQDADFEAILEEELERRRKEAERRPETEDEEAERVSWMEQIEEAAKEIASDPAFGSQLERRHPLAERAGELALRMMSYGDGDRWAPRNAGPEHPAIDMINSVTKAGGKLAGALDARDWPPTLDECALCISWLKRASGLLEDALVAGDFCREQKLVPLDELQPALEEIAAIRAEVSTLIQDLRERLNRGFS